MIQDMLYAVATRVCSNGRLIELGKNNLTSNACISDAIKLWNCAPKELQECATYNHLKKIIKYYMKTLPV